MVFLAFCAFTAALTWPYVLHLRDAVADTGDPYFVSWVLWWDYYQTLTDPLHRFHSNLFFPFHYTLAFTEHSYGIALPFFPLYALGFRPLTVHAVAGNLNGFNFWLKEVETTGDVGRLPPAFMSSIEYAGQKKK